VFDLDLLGIIKPRVRSSSMADMKNQFAGLDTIPGLYIEDIFLEKNGEFVATLKYTTIKQQKIYHLIAGKTGLRFELSSYNRK
jgi:hypothetical protein